MSKEGDYEPTGHKDPEKYSQRGYFGDDATDAEKAGWKEKSNKRRKDLEAKCKENPEHPPCKALATLKKGQ